MSDALDIVERLRACADDPMWAHHAEIPKRWCDEAADEITRLRALSAQPAAVPSIDERAAFEGWIAPTLRAGSHLNRSRINSVYTDNRVAAKWAAWQARARLATAPQAPQQDNSRAG